MLGFADSSCRLAVLLAAGKSDYFRDMTASTPSRSLREPVAWPISIEAYHALGSLGLLPERTELLYGTVYPKMPKSPLHSYLVAWLVEELRRQLGPGHHLRTEQPISCVDSEPEPDLAVVVGDKDDYRDQHPTSAELVIEVCVTSEEYDRAKLAAYARAGVKEVWLILAPERRIEVQRDPAEDAYRTKKQMAGSDPLRCGSLPGLSIIPHQLFGEA